MISAWRIVTKKHPDWTLNIYGGGKKEDFQPLVEKYGLADALKLNGPVSNILEKYLENSIFVLSSRFEGLPLVLMEAMSTGLPSVSFACPCGPRDIIHDGEDGILCENGNIQQLAAGICRLIEDEQLRKEMGRKAAQNIQRFSLENIMTQWDDMLQEIHRTQDSCLA